MAEASFEQVVIKKKLTDMKVKDAYSKKFHVLHPNMNINHALGVLLHSSQDIYPVTDKSKNLLGIITTDRLRKVPDPIRKKVKIKQIMKHNFPKITENHDLYSLLMDMTKNHLTLPPVIKKKKVIGIISKDAIIHFLKIKMAFKI